MKGKLIAVLCLLLVATYTNTNAVENLIAGLENIATGSDVQQVAKALISLGERAIGADLANCVE